jgi:hypothetical protein
MRVPARLVPHSCHKARSALPYALDTPAFFQKDPSNPSWGDGHAPGAVALVRFSVCQGSKRSGHWEARHPFASSAIAIAIAIAAAGGCRRHRRLRTSGAYKPAFSQVPPARRPAGPSAYTAAGAVSGTQPSYSVFAAAKPFRSAKASSRGSPWATTARFSAMDSSPSAWSTPSALRPEAVKGAVKEEENEEDIEAREFKTASR